MRKFYSDNEKIKFLTVKRKAPGAFSEAMIPALSRMVQENPTIELIGVDLADDPFQEKLNIKIRTRDDSDDLCGGTKLSFTLTSELSIADNLAELQSFIADFGKTAGEAPVAELAVGQRR